MLPSPYPSSTCVPAPMSRSRLALETLLTNLRSWHRHGPPVALSEAGADTSVAAGLTGGRPHPPHPAPAAPPAPRGAGGARPATRSGSRPRPGRCPTHGAHLPLLVDHGHVEQRRLRGAQLGEGPRVEDPGGRVRRGKRKVRPTPCRPAPSRTSFVRVVPGGGAQQCRVEVGLQGGRVEHAVDQLEDRLVTAGTLPPGVLVQLLQQHVGVGGQGREAGVGPRRWGVVGPRRALAGGRVIDRARSRRASPGWPG